MEGGKTQRTFKGPSKVEDTQCIYKDKKTFCQYLTKVLDTVLSVDLYHNVKDKTKLVGDEANEALVKLTSSHDFTFTKTFSNRKVFSAELICELLIVDLLGTKYHSYIPVPHLGKGVGKAYGLVIHYKGKKKPTYHTFVDACDAYLDEMTLSETQYKRLTNDIVDVVGVVNSKGYLINGIGHLNIGYFAKNNCFKVLDWQFIRRTNDVKSHKGYMLYAHPLKSYLAGSPAVIAKKNMALAVLLRNNRWVKRLTSFEVMRAFGKSSFEYITQLPTTNKKWVPYFDNYASAILLLIIAEKNKMQAPKGIIDKLIEPFIPII